MLLATGPFSFLPGDVQELDIAFIWARDYSGTYPNGVMGKFREMVDLVSEAFETNTLSNGEVIYGVEETQLKADNPVNIYPNPASHLVTIEFLAGGTSGSTNVEILTNQGVGIMNIQVPASTKSQTIDLSSMATGLYFIRITNSTSQTIRKLLVIQ